MATTLIIRFSARLRRSTSQAGKYEPDRSLGIASSMVPVRVSPLRGPGSRCGSWSARATEAARLCSDRM
jgi:hypothetical protein